MDADVIHYADHQLHRVRVSRQARLSSGHGRIQDKRSHDLCVGNREKTRKDIVSLSRVSCRPRHRCNALHIYVLSDFLVSLRTLITFLLLLRQ